MEREGIMKQGTRNKEQGTRNKEDLLPSSESEEDKQRGLGDPALGSR
jgi:hypothetical protein